MYRSVSYRLTDDKKGGLIDFFGWDEDGNRTHDIESHTCHITYEVDYKTDLISIFNTYLKKKQFSTSHSRRQWVKDHPRAKIFEMSEPEIEYLKRRFVKEHKDDDFAKHDLKTHFLDIEISIEDEFPQPDEAKYPINLITTYDSEDKKYHTFSLYKCDTHRDDTVVTVYDNEKDLLNGYIDWHSSDYPDVITTWNGKSFDIPYVCNRVKKLLGKPRLMDLSPVGKVTKRTDKKTDADIYTIACISHLDYYFLYKSKFLKKSNGSFSLGNVGEFQLGIGKIEYEGSMYDLYTKDFQKFFEYNVRDVEILVKLEEKLQLLRLARKVCNIGLCGYEKIYSSIPYIINSLSLYAWNAKNRVFPTYLASAKATERYEGAYVFPTKAGFYGDGVAIVDLNSLYPNTLISCNMSPETKVGKYEVISDNEIHVHLVSGITRTLTKDQFDKLLDTKCINTTNNVLFYKHEIKKGLITSFCEDMYAERRSHKKVYSKAKRKLSKRDELPMSDIIQLTFDHDNADQTQMALKTYLNTIYGMFGTGYSPIYDVDIAEAITKNGQMVIRAVPELINKHMTEAYGSTEDTLIFGDTDSCGFEYGLAVKQYCAENNRNIRKLSRRDIENICVDLDDFVDNVINPFCANLVNTTCHTTQGSNIVFAREKFCAEAMFFSKKHYVLHIVDKEGHHVDEFDYKGIEIAKNELSKEVKAMLKPIFQRVCKERWNQETFTAELIKIWDEYRKLPFELVAKNTGWNTDKEVLGFLNVGKGAGAHVRSAVYYNQLLNSMGLTRSYEKIQCGNDVQWCYIKPENLYGVDVVGCKTTYPKEFADIFQINYELMYEKNILKPLTPLMGIMNWISFNPNNVAEEDIFSF